MLATYWIILGIVLLIGELFTLDFSLSCFAIACFAAAVTSGAGLGLYWQLGVTTAVIFILLFTLRPLALKHLNKKAKGFRSNTEALVGREAKVFDVHTAVAEGHTHANKARIKIDADEWTVTCTQALKDGDFVRVISIDGTTLTVKKEEN